ncbi:MAG TPA: hypothetical protein VLO07_10050 [Thermoanaerobaculia bacterium]|nr:hypothetical protein [Thermoanaerobaculia bacterium]
MEKEGIAIIAPSLRRARAAAARLGRSLPDRSLRPFSFKGFLASGRAPGQIILCPAGRSVAPDRAFLRNARQRLLWTAPDRVLYSAIAGLITRLPLPTSPRHAGSFGRRATALLLEGAVTPARAGKALEGDARHWIVEDVCRVRLGPKGLAELARRGVHWSVLEPLRVIAVVVSPELARQRSRWRKDLPAKTPVWTWKTKAGRR